MRSPGLFITHMIVKIESTNMRGTGFVHIGAQSMQIPGAIEGECVQLDVIPDRHGRCFGRIRRVLEMSDQRVDPKCDRFPDCPGCSLRHLSASAQAGRIVQRLRQVALKEFQSEEYTIPEPRFHALSPSDHYRIRCALTLNQATDQFVLGMKSRFPGEPPIDLSSCPNHHPDLNKLIQTIDEMLKKGRLPDSSLQSIRDIHFHLSDHGPHRVMFVIMDHGHESGNLKKRIQEIFHLADISVLCLTIKSRKTGIAYKKPDLLNGEPLISLNMRFGLFRALPGVWTPASVNSVEQLIDSLETGMMARGANNLLELGCGAGLMTIPLARKTVMSTGVDKNRFAVESARSNALQLNSPNVIFRTGDAVHAMKKLAARGIRTDCVIAHGMRTPFGSRLIELMEPLENKVTMLLSPSMYAWFQDVHSALTRKWALAQIGIFDQLPQTAGYLFSGYLIKQDVTGYNGPPGDTD
jgi:23S rRNA (uracil1939-C5)-methyltransferase